MKEKPDPIETETKINPPPPQELGLFDSYGSFPVWMLKLIDLATPDFLNRKPPPGKNPES